MPNFDNCVETEKHFKKIFGKTSHDQLFDHLYKISMEIEALQEKNSSLKRAMYGRKKMKISIGSPFSMKQSLSMKLLIRMK